MGRETSPAASRADEALVADLLMMGGVGYVALGRGMTVLMRNAPGLRTNTTPETNFYEELLVNPTLISLARRRALIDCGGLRHIAVGYADFTQLVVPARHGHVSLGVARSADVSALAPRVHAVLNRHERQEAPCALPSAPASRIDHRPERKDSK